MIAHPREDVELDESLQKLREKQEYVELHRGDSKFENRTLHVFDHRAGITEKAEVIDAPAQSIAITKRKGQGDPIIEIRHPREWI